MIKVNTLEQADAEHHRLTINDLRKFKNLSEEVMFDLTNEEFENMMNQIDASACIEPLYFHTSFSEYETQCVGYY